MELLVADAKTMLITARAISRTELRGSAYGFEISGHGLGTGGRKTDPHASAVSRVWVSGDEALLLQNT